MQKELDNNYGRRATANYYSFRNCSQLKYRALPSCRFLDTNLLLDGFEGAQKRARARERGSNRATGETR